VEEALGRAEAGERITPAAAKEIIEGRQPPAPPQLFADENKVEPAPWEADEQAEINRLTARTSPARKRP